MTLEESDKHIVEHWVGSRRVVWVGEDGYAKPMQYCEGPDGCVWLCDAQVPPEVESEDGLDNSRHSSING